MQAIVSEAELLEGNRAFVRAFTNEVSQGPPRGANLDLMLSLDVPRELRMLRYRARRFRVPPVPFREGVALAELQLELKRLSDQESTATPAERLTLLALELQVLRSAAALMWRLIRPVRFWDRLTWRWRANPFDDAEVDELNHLFAFFFAAPTTPPIRWNWARGARFGPAILPPTMRTSPGSIRP